MLMFFVGLVYLVVKILNFNFIVVGEIFKILVIRIMSIIYVIFFMRNLKDGIF